MTGADDPIVEYVEGMATVKDGAVHIADKNIEAILDGFAGHEVKLILAHKPDESQIKSPNPSRGALPPFLWMVNETGKLKRVPEGWSIRDKPFNLNLLPGFNCVLSVVNMDFKVMDPTEMLGSADLRADEKASILDTEKRLREAMGRLSGVLGDMIGEGKK